MLIQMAADLQFHFGNLRIGLPLRVPDPIFGGLSFVMRFNLQIPKIRTAITAKENPMRPQVYDTLWR